MPAAAWSCVADHLELELEALAGVVARGKGRKVDVLKQEWVPILSKPKVLHSRLELRMDLAVPTLDRNSWGIREALAGAPGPRAYGPQ
eukprot:9005110-Pyramimonas_sp.AAC.1